ncbi:hypothetical protein [Psychrobacter sp. I-STPA10]|uniref:hypothetical protein n=1 Tax=Psychrobacter sp. I-STPA10 TaxID=2585769 RepID=UPI001E473A68|nr:hypothetical protein [Psychrobacter sp. I-STPA10]
MQDTQPFIDTVSDNLNDTWQQVISKIKSVYDKASDMIDDEFALPISQKHVNEALQKFVTNNVEAILELRVELHDGWFRLFCTIEAVGIYAEVASNFGLVQVQIDQNVQRFVFAQQTYTDVLQLRCQSFLKRQAINALIWFYHRVLKKDPLGFILSYINIAKPKDNIIYLDIHRWLKKNEKIMSTLHKFHVNYAEVEEEQLLLKSQVKIKNLFINSSGEDILTPRDEPELMDGPINPISDATDPSQA